MKYIKSKTIQLSFFFLILIWCTGIVGEYIVSVFPFLIPLLPFLKINYSIVCHAETEKLIHFSSYATFTCARCSGIYFGSLLISMLTVLGFNTEISIKFLLISSLPIFLDIIFYSLNVYNYSHIISVTSGLFLGSVGFLYIQNTVLDFLKNKT